MATTPEPSTTATQPATNGTATTYARCGETPNVSQGCNRTLVTDDEKRRGICAEFPMCS